MSERGVFAVDRGVFDHPMFDEKAPFSRREAWLWLLSEAAWKPTQRSISGRVVTLSRGQIAHSIRFMAEAWGWDKAKVSRFLERLKTETMIETQTETGQTLITICKYDDYQKVALPKRDGSETPTETAARQQRDKLEDTKTTERRKKEEPRAPRASPAEFAEFWRLYPNKVGKPVAEKSFDKARGIESFETIMAGLRAYVAKTDDRPWCNPTTWLNQQRWADSPAQAGRPAPVADDPTLVSLPPEHPDFQAVQRMKGKTIHVGNSGRATFTKAEIEQARSAAGDLLQGIG